MSNETDASVRIHSTDDKSRKNPALGRGVPVLESNNLIPFETPGREVAIRSRSPFREVPSAPVEDNIRSIDQIHQGVPLSIARSSPESTRSSLRGRGVSAAGTQHMKPPSPMPQTHAYYPPPPGYYPHPQGMVPYPPYPYQQPPQNLPPPMPDYDSMNEQDQEDARIIFSSKFNTLREKYPERSFCDYFDNVNMPLRHIHRIYEDHLSRISAESNFSMSRIFLTVMFLCIEGFFTKFLGINIEGFAMDQIKEIKRYESLLMELGEKYSSSFGANWPVEARIIFLIAFNTLSIAGIKFLCSKIGHNSDVWVKNFNSLIGSTVDNFVQTKDEPQVDPITKTADPDSNDTTENLMGKANEILNFASTLGGGPKTKDPTQTIGHWGSKLLSGLSKNNKDDPSGAGGSKRPEASKGGRRIGDIRFGRSKNKK